jgi:hypothetical protein
VAWHLPSFKEGTTKNVMGVIELIFYLDSLRIDFDEINLFCCKKSKRHNLSMLCDTLKPNILMNCLF